MPNKYTQWEYWPPLMIYIPLLPYALYLALKAKSFGFFSAVNPSLEGSGNGLESKYKSIQLLPDKNKPKTIFIPKEETVSVILEKMQLLNLSFPLIIKPDIGFRGLLVQKINSEFELKNYIYKYRSINLILQEFIDYKNECGIFYYRLPNEKKGVITSITIKKYPSVVGDGKSNILQLIMADERSRIYLEIITELNKGSLKNIPDKNEEVILSIIGNHAKGTQFINGNHLITDKLQIYFDKFCENIEGWNYGRFDIKYSNFEELITKDSFKILEMNGIISEPTHIYDASKGNYFDALKTIKAHWKILYKIGVGNHRIYQTNYTDLRYFINSIINIKKYMVKLSRLAAT